MALAFRLLFVTTITGVVLRVFLRPYVGFMVVIIGVGGVLVAIRFALALLSYWDKVVDGVFMGGLKEGVKRLILVLSTLLIFMSSKVAPKFLDLKFIIFSDQWGVGVLFVGGVLFLSVVVVVFIVRHHFGALMDFKVK
jgi:hypothetical protein